MNGAGTATRPTRTKAVLWLALGAGLLLIANSLLVYVAVTSQPECVAHVRQGEGGAAKDGRFAAARSSCTPR